MKPRVLWSVVLVFVLAEALIASPPLFQRKSFTDSSASGNKSAGPSKDAPAAKDAKETGSGVSAATTADDTDTSTVWWPAYSYHDVWMPDLTYRSLKSNGVDLYCEIEGHGREMAIVVQGSPGIPHDYLHPMLSTLSHYMRVVYFDRRFDGLPKGLPARSMSLKTMADDIEAVRQALGGESVTLIAHGFGGPVAINYTLRHPDAVKRLILANTSAEIENYKEIETRLTASLSPKELDAFNNLSDERARYQMLLPHCFKKAPDGQTLDHIGYSLYFDSLSRRYFFAHESGQFSFRGELRDLKTPTLVIAGRYDLVSPVSQSQQLAKSLSDSRLVVLEHSGHYPQIEENYMFIQQIRQFIAQTTRGLDAVSVRTGIVNTDTAR
ncbi:MAG: hypothetical protein DMF61_25285 [Blastocatellia bacterium AA13]|nr:MAG: hypothetical protein DMF61_25285 [Blastocatellia bacterium AA13]